MKEVYFPKVNMIDLKLSFKKVPFYVCKNCSRLIGVKVALVEKIFKITIHRCAQ